MSCLMIKALNDYLFATRRASRIYFILQWPFFVHHLYVIAGTAHLKQLDSFLKVPFTQCLILASRKSESAKDQATW